MQKIMMESAKEAGVFVGNESEAEKATKWNDIEGIDPNGTFISISAQKAIEESVKMHKQ